MRHKFIAAVLCLCSMFAFADDYYLLIQFERQKAYQAARDYVEKSDNNNTDLDIIIARIDIHQKHYMQAEMRLKQVIAATPQSIDAYILLSGVLAQQGYIYQALQYAELGLIINPLELSLYPRKYGLTEMLTKTKLPYRLGMPEAATKKTVKWLGKLKDYPREQAIQMAQAYLTEYPKDGDVALELSAVLFQAQQYQASIDLLLPYLKLYPDYTDLRLGVINAYIQQKRYQLALDKCEQGLKKNAQQADLLKKQADIRYLLTPDAKKPVETSPAALPKVAEEKKYLNELGVFEQLYYISDKRQGWDYTGAFYGRETPLGKLYGRVNYASRLKREGNQYAVEFFPKLGKYVYLDLYAGFANQPVLFPDYTYSGEAFVVLPKLFDFSIGAQFNHIVNNLQYSRFTASVSKQVLKDLTLTFKPYFFFPGSGNNSILYTMSFRQMLNEPWLYWGMMVGSGTTPDLANFETVNFLVLRNPIILSPYLNFSLFHDQFLINTSFLFQRQLFPEEFNKDRNWIGGTLGVTWRF